MMRILKSGVKEVTPAIADVMEEVYSITRREWIRTALKLCVFVLGGIMAGAILASVWFHISCGSIFSNIENVAAVANLYNALVNQLRSVRTRLILIGVVESLLMYLIVTLIDYCDN